MASLPGSDPGDGALGASDEQFMRRAIGLAANGRGQVAPNPMVGAVLVREGSIISEGWHARVGEEHAEAMALRLAGESARGATAYVTLEPCDHYGRTPPCSRALIQAGVSRVVYAVADPTALAGGGAERLRSAGVSVTPGVLEREASELIAPFLFAASAPDRPWVTLKLAVSMDGAIAGAGPERTWLTGPEANARVHELRSEADAIAVGIGTAIADDPELTVRLAPPPRVAPLRVVFDRRARLPITGKLMTTAPQVPVLVLTDGSDPQAERQLTSRGARVVPVSDLEAGLRSLRTSGVRHVLIEGGAGLASALVRAGVVDRLITFQAPVVLGAGAVSAFADGFGGTCALQRIHAEPVGNDFMSVYRFVQRNPTAHR